jgi:hypothetical protein
MRRQSHGYFRGRASAPESPLLVARQPFVYRNKSQFAFRWAAWAGGTDPVDRAIDGLTRDHRYAGAPFPTTVDLEAGLATQLPDTLSGDIENWFERIVVWDLEARSARARRIPGGYEVEVDVSAARRAVDTAGKITELRSVGMVELGLYDEDGREQTRSSRRLSAGTSTVRLVTKEPPVRVVLDPGELLLDPVQEDDETPVVPPEERAPGGG